jgi:hypothetical protein
VGWLLQLVDWTDGCIAVTDSGHGRELGDGGRWLTIEIEW